jgi:hypothetical protein
VGCLLIISTPVVCVRFEMIVYYRIIGHVINSQSFRIVWLLIDVMLSSSPESFIQVKFKVKVSGLPQVLQLSFKESK